MIYPAPELAASPVIAERSMRKPLPACATCLLAATLDIQGQHTFTNGLIKPLSQACSTANLAKGAKMTAWSNEPSHEPAMANDGQTATSWRATARADQWLQLDSAQPITVNEFRIKEDASSSIARYVIECWDDRAAKWVGCFNGMAIGSDFIAPIVSRTTTRTRLLVKRTGGGNPAIVEFEAYNDTTNAQTDRPPSGQPPTGT